MRSKNRKVTTYFILFSLLLIGVVYAILQANLQINGTAKIQANTWNIHFDNIQVNENSVSIGENDIQATIDPENNCKVDFEVTLSIPGDFYEFTIDVVNAGTIDGMIGELTQTLKVNNETVSEVPDYLNYSVTYVDGTDVEENHIIIAGYAKKIRVRLEFKTDIEELPEAATISTSLEPQYIQADSSSVYYREVSFATDSWSDIIDAYKVGNIKVLEQAMEAGTTRAVQLDLDNNGTAETTRHVRIANLSTPSECEASDFSETACGFVLEFADIITKHNMNPSGTYKGTNYSYGWNVDGWPASSMYSYVNTDIYNALPYDLKSIVIDTIVVSGHGSTTGETNFTSIDKLFLFDDKEIYGTNYHGATNTAINQERQLDYYSYIDVTSSNIKSAAKKKLNSNVSSWWLRSAYSDTASGFHHVNTDGQWWDTAAFNVLGVSPAFRIAE